MFLSCHISEQIVQHTCVWTRANLKFLVPPCRIFGFQQAGYILKHLVISRKLRHAKLNYATRDVQYCRVISVASYCIQKTDSARPGRIRSHSGVVFSHLITPPQRIPRVHDHERDDTKPPVRPLKSTHHISCSPARDSMDPTWRIQLIKRRAVAKASLTRLQNFLEAGDLKVNEIKVRLGKLTSILNKYESAQDELECLDEADYSLDREEFENQYYQVEAKFSKLLHPVMNPPSRRSSPRSSLSGHSNHTPRSHTSSTHIKLPTIALPTFEGDTCSWLHYRDTFEALVVNNTNLSNVQKLHYLISSLKNEAKDLIRKLQITN